MLRFAASLAVLAALMGPADAAPFRLIVTDLEAPLMPNSVMDLAVSLGYFEREKTSRWSWSACNKHPLAITALQAGEGEMANIASIACFSLPPASSLTCARSCREQVTGLHDRRSGFSISDVCRSCRQEFGVGRIGSVDQTLSRQVLANQGVDVDGLNLVRTGSRGPRSGIGRSADRCHDDVAGHWTTLPRSVRHEGPHRSDAYFRGALRGQQGQRDVARDTIKTRRPEVVAVVTALTKRPAIFQLSPQNLDQCDG